LHHYSAQIHQQSTIKVHAIHPGAATDSLKGAPQHDFTCNKKVGTEFALVFSSENDSCTTVEELAEIFG
jgi:hypothetical protein